ncbi:hypothetical protein C9374_007267 [Naegleria lovaniensis]|uniref:Ras family small GTPase n=1 Tax=Naegleria lovaniensis TaxID=51637 RepID=A0AA88H4T0_NAELO|nr:uncharacterized protein C9374_007267 [Naegleria lovaniensis]KAG2393736.1 hypothetical protein C9374_007267 [Naegleria lovaniensis]
MKTVKYSICVMGAALVGKQEFAKAATELFDGKIIQVRPGANKYIFTVEFQNCKYELSMITLYDTGFTTEEKEELKTHIDGYLLMYDVTNKFSTERVKNYMKLILQLLDPSSPLLAEMNKNSWQNVHKKKKESAAQKQQQHGSTRNQVSSPSSEPSSQMSNVHPSTTVNSEQQGVTTTLVGDETNGVSSSSATTLSSTLQQPQQQQQSITSPSSPSEQPPLVVNTSTTTTSMVSVSSKTPSTPGNATSPSVTTTNATSMSSSSNSNQNTTITSISSNTTNISSSSIASTPTCTTTTASSTILPVIIIGNKCDVSDEEREVDTKEGLKLSDYLGCPLVETSATFKKKGIENAFIELIKRIDKVREEKRKTLVRAASMAGSSVADDSTIDRRKSISSIFSFVSVSTSDNVVDDYQQTRRMREMRKQQLASNNNK